MRLYRTAVIETAEGRFVEIDFADQPETLEGQTMHLRILAQQDGYPRIPEVIRAALQRAQNVIGDEIKRLEQTRGRVDLKDYE